MDASDVMSRDPVTVEETATVREAIDLLVTLDVRHLPVTANGRLVGMISDRDVRQLTVPVSWNMSIIADEGDAGTDDNPLDQPVTTVMSGGTISVAPDAKLSAIVDVICDQRIGALPVVDADGKVVGIVSYVDLLRALRPTD